MELLRRGWSVLAIDSEAGAIERLTTRPDLPRSGSLETKIARFEDATWLSADLINASFTLFFGPADGFPTLWQKIIDSLKPGGRFAGQLLGERDSWAAQPDVAIHDRAALDRLLTGLTIEMHEIEETDAVTPRGDAKHWHLHHLVLRKA